MDRAKPFEGSYNDQSFMRQALMQARKAARIGEIPVGAVLVNRAGTIVARAYNQTVKRKSPLGHAEILAINRAARACGDWRLNGYTLYVTLEPCALCMHLILMSRIARVVYATCSPIYGFSLDKYCIFDLYKKPLAITSGVEAGTAQQYLRRFFRQKRSGCYDAQKVEKGRAGESKEPVTGQKKRA
jgi:tRNA(adenine34) deaminase